MATEPGQRVAIFNNNQIIAGYRTQTSQAGGSAASQPPPLHKSSTNVELFLLDSNTLDQGTRVRH